MRAKVRFSLTKKEDFVPIEDVENFHSADINGGFKNYRYMVKKPNSSPALYLRAIIMEVEGKFFLKQFIL